MRQEKKQDTFTIINEKQLNIDAGLGFRNILTIDDIQLLANMQELQKRYSLPLNKDLSGNQICVEMETGTGKTYAYTKTIYVLHKSGANLTTEKIAETTYIEKIQVERTVSYDDTRELMNHLEKKGYITKSG